MTPILNHCRKYDRLLFQFGGVSILNYYQNTGDKEGVDIRFRPGDLTELRCDGRTTVCPLSDDLQIVNCTYNSTL
jgi:hypothetical protein